MEQRVSFATARDGTRLAFAVHGSGPPLVKAAHWLTHVEYEWDSPLWRPWLTALGAHNTVLRYDERGCGLSDWQVDDFSLDAWVDDLETVVDAAGLERFAVLGMSQGAPVAISYAVRHPERVSHLLIFGGYLRGWRRRGADQARLDEHEAMITLMRLAWGRDNPIFRRMFTEELIPDADEALMRSFDELERRTTSPENAARFENAFGDIDVRSLAPGVRAPTLVIHVDGDRTIPLSEGRQIAAAIPHARFALIEGRNHILRPDDPTWPKFFGLVRDFLGTDRPAAAGADHAAASSLTPRQRAILRLVADGRSNEEIANALGLSVRTIERHLSNSYLKLGLEGRSARPAAAAVIGRTRS